MQTHTKVYDRVNEHAKSFLVLHENMLQSASVAELDARLTGDQAGGCGFDPLRVGNILSWR